MQRLLIALLFIVASASTALAQTGNSKPPADKSDPFPRFEIFAGYSAIETNDHTFHFSPNITASKTDFDEGGHGFEAAITRNFNRYFGIVGDFSSNFSFDQGPTKFTPRCSQPPCAPVTQNASLDPRLFNFLAGPEFKWRNHTRLTPFAHALVGVTHTTCTFQTAGPALTISRTDADTGFGMTLGGGVEIRIFKRLSIRTSVDYGKAYVGSGELPPQRVNSIRMSIGIIFH